MKFLRRWINNWLNTDDYDDFVHVSETPSIGYNTFETQGFNLRIWRADGGTIVESNYYSRKKDQGNNKLYIITDEKDLGQELAKIVTIEGLKHNEHY